MQSPNELISLKSDPRKNRYVVPKQKSVLADA